MWHNIVLFAAGIDLSPLPNLGKGQNTFISTVLSIVIGTTAAISLLFITIGGFRYILSQGDPQAVSKAKGTIVYALIGLVIAITARLIVNFVLSRIK